MSNQGLEIVFTRNIFYAKNFRSASINFFLLVAAIISLGSFVIFMHITTIYTLYFPTTPSGEYIDMPPLTKNHLVISKDDFTSDGRLKAYPEITLKDLGDNINPETALVEYWAKKAVLELFDLDYVNYRKALQDVRDYFTLSGHGEFLKALEFSGNLKAVKNNFRVASARIIGKLSIASGIYDNKAAWKINIPIEATYENVSGAKLIQRQIAKMTIVRETTLRSPFFGLAIDEINLSPL